MLLALPAPALPSAASTTAAITDSTKSITITKPSGGGFPSQNFAVAIDVEGLLISKYTAPTMTVYARGALRSAAAAHNAGAPVVLLNDFLPIVKKPLRLHLKGQNLAVADAYWGNHQWPVDPFNPDGTLNTDGLKLKRSRDMRRWASRLWAALTADEKANCATVAAAYTATNWKGATRTMTAYEFFVWCQSGQITGQTATHQDPQLIFQPRIFPNDFAQTGGTDTPQYSIIEGNLIPDQSVALTVDIWPLNIASQPIVALYAGTAQDSLTLSTPRRAPRGKGAQTKLTAVGYTNLDQHIDPDFYVTYPSRWLSIAFPNRIRPREWTLGARIQGYAYMLPSNIWTNQWFG